MAAPGLEWHPRKAKQLCLASWRFELPDAPRRQKSAGKLRQNSHDAPSSAVDRHLRSDKGTRLPTHLRRREPPTDVWDCRGCGLNTNKKPREQEKKSETGTGHVVLGSNEPAFRSPNPRPDRREGRMPWIPRSVSLGVRGSKKADPYRLLSLGTLTPSWKVGSHLMSPTFQRRAFLLLPWCAADGAGGETTDRVSMRSDCSLDHQMSPSSKGSSGFVEGAGV